MRDKQSGIGGLVVVAAIVVIGVIALVGWKLSKADGSVATAPAAVENQQTQPKAETKRLSQAEIAVAPAESTVFSKLPAALQSVALAEIQKQVPPCVKDGKLVDNAGEVIDPPVDYAPVGAAIIGIGCDGSSAGLFTTDKQGEWKFIQKTQMAFSCEAVFTNRVPKQLLERGGGEASCFIDETQLPYDEASKKYFY